MKVLIIPGYGGSGPEHWQSLWEENHPGFVRVPQRDWDHPVCHEWVQNLEQAVVHSGPQTLLVAHSLGCHTVAHWAAQTQRAVSGALLVAPPDLDGPDCPPQVVGYQPVPMQALPFPSMVVASSNDPHASLEYAQACARAWGSGFEDVGPLGHINAQSGIADWPQGYALLQRLAGSIE